jgi:hypothetical protein
VRAAGLRIPDAVGRLSDAGRRHPDAVAALTLFLLPWALLGRALLPGRVLSPADILFLAPLWKALAPGLSVANPTLSDVAVALHPWLILAGRELGHGHFPLWNPYAYAGAPFFANPNTALLFPLTWLAAVLPAATALTVIAILKLSAAGCGMYWFLRLLRIGRPSAWVGALAFMLSGSMIVWLEFPISSAFLFMPPLFAAVERIRDHPARRAVAVLALITAIAFFAGYPQGAYLGLLAAGAWALSRAPGAPGGAWRFLVRAAAGAALGGVLAAAQLLPFLEYMRESAAFAYRTEWMPLLSLSPRSAAAFFLPYYYGGPRGGEYWGEWNFNEIALTVGLIPWATAPVAVAAAWRRTGTRFFLGMALIAAAMLYALPGTGAVRAILPGLSLAINLRFGALVAFPLCALGAIGLDAAVAGAGARRARWAVAGTFVLIVALLFASLVDDWASISHARLTASPALEYAAFLALFTSAVLLILARYGRPAPARPGWWAAVIAVELATLLPLAATYNPVIDTRWLYPTPPAVSHLQRAMSREPGRVLLEANVPALYGLSDVSGYDSLAPRRIDRLLRPTGDVQLQSITGTSYLGPLAGLSSPLIDMLAVRRVVVWPNATLFGARFTLEYEGPDARVYRNDQALPRARLVGRARCAEDDAALRLIWQGGIDLRREVLLAGCTAPLPDSTSSDEGSARIVEDGWERVRIATDSAGPTWLVLADTWFPGWRVWVDGREQTVWRANYAFRAVRLESGSHDVVFRYRPRSVLLGFALSAAAALIALGLVFLPPRRRGVAE